MRRKRVKTEEARVWVLAAGTPRRFRLQLGVPGSKYDYAKKQGFEIRTYAGCAVALRWFSALGLSRESLPSHHTRPSVIENFFPRKEVDSKGV